MDLKIFPNTIMLLKVDYFEGFSNQHKVNELVINNMSGCNYIKITNLLIKIRAGTNNTNIQMFICLK